MTTANIHIKSSMQVNGKIQNHHRDRLAIVYIRQSTLQQVERHSESTKLQYALVEKAFDLVLIGDGGFACIRLGHACIKQKVTLISRLRLDAALYDFAPLPAKGQRGRHREKGDRATSLKALALDLIQPWRDVIVDW